MNKPQLFDHPMFGEIRIIEISGKPFFVGNDVARSLEYARPYEAVSTHCKGAVSHRILTNGGEQEMKLVPEGDIYRLIVKAADQSKNPAIKERAEKFESWIFDEVLPSIRKTGTYSIDRPSYMIDDPIDRAQKWIDEERQRQALMALNRERDEQLYLQAPKVALYDTAMNAKNNFTMERVSKTVGYGRNKLFDFLREKKILRTNNMPYQEYLDRGYFDVRQYSITHLTSGIENKTQTLVTPKGMAYIHKLLTEGGKIS